MENTMKPFPNRSESQRGNVAYDETDAAADLYSALSDNGFPMERVQFDPDGIAGHVLTVDLGDDLYSVFYVTDWNADDDTVIDWCIDSRSHGCDSFATCTDEAVSCLTQWIDR